MHAVHLFRPDATPSDNAPMGVTVREIIDRYLVSSEKNAVHGVEARAERVRALRDFAAVQVDGRSLGDFQVSECKPFHLTDWIESRDGWKSSSTRKGKANSVNAAFNWACRQKRIPDNPFSGVRYDESEPRPPMEDRLLETVSDSANKRFEEFTLYLRLTGRRLSEVCGLNWSDIDWSDGVVRLRKHKTRRKTKRDQFYLLVPEALELLGKIRERSTGDGPVFLNSRGRRWNKGSAGQYLYRLKRRLGITEKATLGGLRHQFGTVAVRNGAPLKFVSLQMGHADTRTTERNYLHLDGAKDEIRAAAALGAKRRDSEKTE